MDFDMESHILVSFNMLKLQVFLESLWHPTIDYVPALHELQNPPTALGDSSRFKQPYGVLLRRTTHI